MQDHPPTLITAKALNRFRRSLVGVIVMADSERSINRYQVLMKMMRSAIETARYTVDKENMKTIIPNRIFWLSECRPFFLQVCIELDQLKRFIQKEKR
jgi:hypothetical protein